ncbi:MFS transporter [Alicyclobacillus macrosporangiidus]|uniref:MFS transporter, DHA1 family, multidrug resistance protein n=1 Tax=Alicyclobacillus macrosporangiidus TaxID=392015 RepID=A0A1I7F7X2_9BACL|nr:MFS transporter [Alicyclobacillus macrosporangiidus]SFU32272.1 MFS transporter, DHA1 family, multidrug resistance protein [Alicyclobacillus macrosporangiidus]
MERAHAAPAASPWQRTLWVMCAVQGIMMMAFSSMSPFLPLYIEELGVRDPRAVDLWAGVIASSNFLIMALVSPLWGAIADRRGRKLMVLRTTVAISFFTFVMGWVHNVWELLGARVLQGAFSGYSASATALVATVVPEEKLGTALGWMQSSAMIGALVGPLAGGLVSDHVHSYRVVFYLTSAFAMTAFLITFFLVKEGFHKPAAAPANKRSFIGQFRAVRALKPVQAMFLVLFLAQFSVMNVQPVLPVYIKELAAHSQHVATYSGLAFAVTGLAGLVAAPIIGNRSDRLGYRRTLVIAMFGAGLFYIPQALAQNIWVFIFSRFGLGLFVGGILPTANALVGRLAPKDQRGQIYGFTSSSTFLGSFAGPLLGGFGSALFGIRTMLGLTAALYLLNMLWVYWKVQDPPAMDHTP